MPIRIRIQVAELKLTTHSLSVLLPVWYDGAFIWMQVESRAAWAEPAETDEEARCTSFLQVRPLHCKKRLAVFPVTNLFLQCRGSK
jgi:hypothetical protein